MSYQWEWGDKGDVCGDHVGHLRQKSIELNRLVHILPLGQTAFAVHKEVPRDELELELERVNAELVATKATLGEKSSALTAATREVYELRAQIGNMHGQVAAMQRTIDEVAAPAPAPEAPHP